MTLYFFGQITQIEMRDLARIAANAQG